MFITCTNLFHNLALEQQENKEHGEKQIGGNNFKFGRQTEEIILGKIFDY